MPLGLQLGEQNLLMAQAIGKECLIKGGWRWPLAYKKLLGCKLLPPCPDSRAKAEEGELTGGYEPIHPDLIESGIRKG
jgi:hypothetical protein